MPDWLPDSWHLLFAAAVLAADVFATAHVILNKRDTQAAIGWVGMIWFVPAIGPAMYYTFGINRIERRAKRLKGHRSSQSSTANFATADILPTSAAYLAPYARVVHALSGARLLAGNAVTPLHNGTDAYAAMLAAIDGAAHSIGLSTYIFNDDEAGKRFIDALGRASARGVIVRVLIDDIGSRYSWPRTAVRPLRAAGIPVALFLPQLLPWHFHYANMRNHRKLLLVDGRIGFTGGMNIQAGNDPQTNPKFPIADMHFRLEGPVVAHLREAFADDWEFCTGATLSGRVWFPKLVERGPVHARGIRFGPDDGFMRLRAVYLGALASAQTSVRIVTPYFLPDAALIAGLTVAALRGVTVDIVLPEQNNLRLVQWACLGQLEQVLEHGCRVWFAPPPFAHTKLMIVDRQWVLFGSSNWDPRSFRLNFEFDVESYDTALSGELDDEVANMIGRSSEMTFLKLQQRTLLAKLRDGAARLLIPYL